MTWPMLETLRRHKAADLEVTHLGWLRWQCDGDENVVLTPPAIRALAAELIQIADEADKVREKG